MAAASGQQLVARSLGLWVEWRQPGVSGAPALLRRRHPRRRRRAAALAVPHLALVGDGILANAAHTKGQADTASGLRRLLPAWTVSLVAAEGSTISDVAAQ